MANDRIDESLLTSLGEVSEELTLTAGAAALWRQSDPPPRGPGAHLHDCWELRVVVCGEVAWPDEPDEAHPRLLLVPPWTVHRFVDWNQLGPGSAVLTLTDQGRWRFLLGESERAEGGHLSSGECRSAMERQMGGPVGEMLASLAEDWEAMAYDVELRRFWEHRMRSLLLAFLRQIRRRGRPHRSEAELVTKARDEIEGLYVRPDLTVAQLAEACGVSRTHLAQAFRRQLGVGPRQVLIRHRLERALALLRTGEYRVNEAAHLTGWRSAYHFSRSFHEHYGCRPSEVRGG